MGQQDNERAMALDDFLTETMTILSTEPDVQQILVEKVKLLRFAEAEGSYDKVFTMLSGH